MADDHVAKRTDRGLAVQEPVLASWAAILRSVNGSRLVLKDRTLIDCSQQARILTAFAAHGVATERVTLLICCAPGSRPDYWSILRIVLNPFAVLHVVGLSSRQRISRMSLRSYAGLRTRVIEYQAFVSLSSFPA